jgi:hypothetical protein
MQSLTVPRGGIAQRVREHIQQAEVGRVRDCAKIQQRRGSDLHAREAHKLASEHTSHCTMCSHCR